MEQAAILAGASLFVRFIGFLYRLPITNLIGDVGNAYYGHGYNIYMFVLIMSSAGLPAAISKMVSERIALGQYRNAHEVFRSAMAVALISGAAGSLLLGFGADFLAKLTLYPESVYAIRVLSPTLLIVAAMAVYRGYFQGMHNTIPTAFSQVVEQIFNAASSVLLAYWLYDAAHVEYAAAGGTAGTGIGALAGLLVVMGLYSLVARPIRVRAHTDRGITTYEPREKLVREILRTALPIIVGTAIFSIANFIDTIMMQDRLAASGAFSTEEIDALAGQFTGKYVLLTTLPVSLSAALATAAVPSIAGSQVALDHRAVRGKINMSLRLSMIISIPAAVGLGVLSDPILKLLFSEYSEGGLLLRFGVVTIIFLALVQIVTGVLQGIGRVGTPVIGALLGTLVKIPLNYFLIANPAVNVIGAVISTSVCYIVAAGADIFFLRRYTGVTPDFAGAFVKPLAAAAAMGLACYITYNIFMLAFESNTAATLLAIGIGMLVYLIFMVLLRGFKREDLKIIPAGARVRKWLEM